MSMNYKKYLLYRETYKDSNCFKHNHNYNIKHLLIITNINKHASSNYYNSKKYYYVLKCDHCDSFIPDSVPGNYSHCILKDEIIDYSLPIITANTLQKNPAYDFCKLIDVKVK